MMLSIWNNRLAIIVIVHHQYCRMIKTQLPALKTSGVSKYNSGRDPKYVLIVSLAVYTPSAKTIPGISVSRFQDVQRHPVCSNRQRFTHLNFLWHHLPTRVARKFIRVTHGLDSPSSRNLILRFSPGQRQSLAASRIAKTCPG